MNQGNPYREGTGRYHRRRIRNLLGFDAPASVSGEAHLCNAELEEVVQIVEDTVGNADTSVTEGESIERAK